MNPELTPALYPLRVTHLRRSPVHHYAEHRSYSWYVDIDRLPRLPRWLRPFARFEAVDHFDGAPGDTLRQRVDTFLARHDIRLPGGQVTALLMPRVLGRAFSPKRCALPITALRLTPPRDSAIWLAVSPFSQRLRSVSIRSSVQDMVGVEPFLLRLCFAPLAFIRRSR